MRCVPYSEAHEKHASSRSLNVLVLRLREALHALVFIVTVEKSLIITFCELGHLNLLFFYSNLNLVGV